MIIAFLTLISSVILYIFAPEYYSYNYCLWLLAVYVFSVMWFIRRSLYGNYLNFHLLFFFSYFFVNFVYPVFYYPMDPVYFNAFKNAFNDDVISRSTALALLGASSYIMGAIYMQSRMVKNLPNSSVESEWLSKISKILTSCACLAFVLFLLLVGRDALRGIFNSYSASANYILIGFQTLFALALILSFLAKQDSFGGTFVDFFLKFSKPILLFIFLVVMFFFYVGDRGPALQIMIIFGASYSLYIKAIKFKGLAVVLLIGMFVLTFIAYARSADPANAEIGNSLTSYLERGRDRIKINSPLDLGMDLIVNNRNLYVAVDLVDQHKINYGKTMLPHIVAVIPGGRALMATVFGIDMSSMTSGRLITDLAKEKPGGAGLGTSIIGDMYLSWGVVGVIILMMLFGYLNMKFQRYALETNNLFYVVIYMISMSHAIYYPRASMFLAIRVLAWPVLILVTLKFFFPNRANLGKLD